MSGVVSQYLDRLHTSQDITPLHLLVGLLPSAWAGLYTDVFIGTASAFSLPMFKLRHMSGDYISQWGPELKSC